MTLCAKWNITAILIIEVSRFSIISQDIIDYFLVLFLSSRVVFLKLNDVVMFPIPFIQVIHFFDETLFVSSRENRCQQFDFHRAITNLFFELRSETCICYSPRWFVIILFVDLMGLFLWIQWFMWLFNLLYFLLFRLLFLRFRITMI